MDRKRNLLGALGLAVLGTLLLVGYVRAAEGRATAGQRLVPVLVLTDDVERGASPRELAERVQLTRVPAAARAAGALTAADQLDGRAPAVDLYEGEQLSAARLAEPETLAGGLPDGTTAVSLSLEPQRALGGQVRPGTEVNVLASYDDPARTETVLRDVVVQSVTLSEPPQDPAEAPAATEGVILVTVAVTAGQAEQLVFAADHGRLWLAGTDNVPLGEAVDR